METSLVNVCLTSNFLSNNENREIYAVRRPSAQRASAVAPTQAEAIEIAREMNPGTAPLVERVRNTSGGHRDKWRKP